VIHIVVGRNRGLYRRQIQALFPGRWPVLYASERPAAASPAPDEHEDAVYLLALDADERVEVGLKLRPVLSGGPILERFPDAAGPQGAIAAPPVAWESSRPLFAGPGPRPGMRLRARTLEIGLAAAEYVLAAGGRRTVAVLTPEEVCAWQEAAVGGAPRIVAPQGEDHAAACLELDPAAVRAGRDMLGEPADVRLAYEIDQEDLRAFGALALAERAVDEARRFPGIEGARDRTMGAAQARALYARHDSVLSRGAARSSWRPPAPRRAEGPRQLH
jgi:hypothetical protein